MSLEGRVALVTGAGRGIGRAIALALAREGASVALASRTDAEIRAVARQVEGLGRKAHAHACDLTDGAQAGALFESVRGALGDPQILVNNAGAALSAKFLETDDAAWERMLRLNLLAAVYCAREALPAMTRTGFGRIVNVASTAAKTGYRYTTAYTASKHALLGFTRALALEVADRGVTVNAVCPGFVDTAIGRAAIETIARKTKVPADEARRRLESMNPQGRLVTPEEVASLVAYLANAAAGGVNGQGWNLDGGAVED